MRVLTIANCPLVDTQGSGYVILNYARRLRARGHQVALLGPERVEMFQWMRLGKRHRQAAGMLLASLVRARRERFDVIEFYGAESCIATSILHKWSHRKSLLVSHSNGIEPFCAVRMERWLGHATLDAREPRWFQQKLRLPLERAFTMVDGVVTVSENDAAFVRSSEYQPQERVLALENPLDESFLSLDVSYRRSQNIGFCGSWLPLKGSQLIQQVLPRVLHACPGATLTLIGVGDAFDPAAHFPREMLSRVRVHPYVSDRADLREIYQRISILMMPSIYESFCLASAEAMACGCALVATDTGFAAGLRHMEEAFVYGDPTVSNLEAGLITLLGDDALRVRLAQAGYARVQQLRWDAAVNRLEGTYERWAHELRSGRSE